MNDQRQCKYCGKEFKSFRQAELCEKKHETSADMHFKRYNEVVDGVRSGNFEYIPTTSPRRPVQESFESTSKKPPLVRCGKNFINPADVSSIREVKDGLYIVKFKSDPEPTYPCWIREKDIEPLIKHFEVIE